MGSVVGSILGTAGGAGGTGFKSPGESRIDQPVSTQQATDSYNANQDALKQQQAFVNALQGLGGVQNQANVYGQLQGIANGTGPNPAQAMLNQATGANVANQAALMAGQRGSSANVGLMARQAAQQGAATQQQAAGQAATQQAQQSLGAIGQMAGISGQQIANQQAATQGLTQAQQNEQSQLLNSIAAANSTRAGLQANINSSNAGLANTAMQGQQGMLGGATNALGAGLGGLFAQGGQVKRQMYDDGGAVMPNSGQYMPVTGPDVFDTPPAAMQAPSIPSVPVPQAPQPQQKSSFSNFVHASRNAPQGLDPKTQAAGPDFGNHGANALYKGVSSLGDMFKPSVSKVAPDAKINMDQAGGASDVSPGQEAPQMYAAKGGKVPAMVSPGEVYLPPHKVKEVVKEGKDPIQEGKKVPGKPKVGGDVNSYANDTVPATLEEGGIVLPRSVTQSKNPHWAAHKFVLEVMKKKGKK